MASRGPIVSNKPNFPEVAKEDHRQEPALSAANGPEALRLPPVPAQTCETKPICPRRAAPPTGAESESLRVRSPIVRHRLDAPLRETKPIPGGRAALRRFLP
jgi:hypothetical protein